METWLQKLIAKLVVIPALFSFVFTCCHPVMVQAAENLNIHQEQTEQSISSAFDLKIQGTHHCDHEKRTQEQTIQAPTQKVSVDFSLFKLHSALNFVQINPTVDLRLAARHPITGPPWIGKSIKGYLGVYRS